MNKIYWDLEKDKLEDNVRTVLICQDCGWLITNPRTKSERGIGVDDSEKCSNCGVKITNSIQEIKKEKKK